jgi:dTDP-4-dehydrorhamnose reductase
MRFLVVGASGFVGSHLLAHIRRAGWQALGTRSRPSGDQRLLALDLAGERITDRVPREFFDAPGSAWVVVCACLSQIDRCRRESAVSRQINVTGTRRLIEDACERGARVVFLSSSFVFDGSRGPYKEDALRAPLSEYGRHKAEIEDFLAARPGRSLVLRLDKIIGDDPREKHLLSEWQALARAGAPIECIAGQVISPTLVDDVARGIVAACALNLTGVYHLANPESIARSDLAAGFVEAIGLDARIVCREQSQFGFADLRPLQCSLDSSRFIAATRLRFTPLREIFATYRAWLATATMAPPAGPRAA